MSNPNDYTVSLYTYCKGKLGTVIENWSYGMGGAIVYEYLPHKMLFVYKDVILQIRGRNLIIK